MSLVDFIKVYLVALPIFFAIDMIWLGLVAKSFYRKHLGSMMRPRPNWIAAMVFYLVFIAGIVFFAVLPGMEAGSWGTALLNGALFGCIAFATYDLTNLATMKDWPVIVTIVDLCWGTILSGSVAGLTYWVSGILRVYNGLSLIPRLWLGTK